MTKKMMVMMAVGVVCAMGSVQADEACAKALPKNCVKLDANKDGKLCKEECAKNKGLTKRFAKCDKNKDGFLTADEIPAKKKKGKKKAE